MGPLAVAAIVLMTAAETLPCGDRDRVDPFDGRSLPYPWSGQPLFSAPTTLIAHIDHGRRFHLGFDTDCPRFDVDWKPHRLNARMELWKSNWMTSRFRFSTLVAILQSTRALSRQWLRILADASLVPPSKGLLDDDLDLDLDSLYERFRDNDHSKLERGWSYL
jgi:hypothetical protein